MLPQLAALRKKKANFLKFLKINFPLMNHGVSQLPDSTKMELQLALGIAKWKAMSPKVFLSPVEKVE